jgi:solute carrier family 25 (mitochondrial thiamine pyrophosphate transporter), member 19
MDKHLTSVGEIVAGGLAGAFSRFVVAPFDVIKIHMQLERGQRVGTAVAKSSMSKIAVKTFRAEGIVGLWRGNAPAMALWVLYAAVQFPVNVRMKQYFSTAANQSPPRFRQT